MDSEQNLSQMENIIEPKEGVLTILDNLKFNFAPEIVETRSKAFDSKKFSKRNNTNGLSTSSSSPSSPVSPTGLGELRHARDKLKLDLPFNHNADLGTVINKKINRI